MVAMRTSQPAPEQEFEAEEIEGVDFLSPEESVAFFDRLARMKLGISGEEFLHRWDAGEYQPVPDTKVGRKVGRLVMSMPFAGRPLP